MKSLRSNRGGGNCLAIFSKTLNKQKNIRDDFITNSFFKDNNTIFCNQILPQDVLSLLSQLAWITVPFTNTIL